MSECFGGDPLMCTVKNGTWWGLLSMCISFARSRIGGKVDSMTAVSGLRSVWLPMWVGERVWRKSPGTDWIDAYKGEAYSSKKNGVQFFCLRIRFSLILKTCPGSKSASLKLCTSSFTSSHWSKESTKRPFVSIYIGVRRITLKNMMIYGIMQFLRLPDSIVVHWAQNSLSATMKN